MKIPSGMLIRKNVLVDPFMADLKTVALLEPARYLPRVPFMADQCFDQDPGGDLYVIPGFRTPVQSKLMSLLGSITFQSTIASEFSANRGFINLDKMCNFQLLCLCQSKMEPLCDIESP